MGLVSHLLKTPVRDSGTSSDSFDSNPKGRIDTPFEAPQGPNRSEVRAWVRMLLRAPDSSDPKAQEAMGMLRQIEERCGSYVLASDILVFLRSISEEQFQGRMAAKNRAYGLVAELLVKSTYAQLEAIEREGRVLGPAIFQGYCAEILDALFARSNARKGIEAMRTLTDWLLAKSIEQTEYAPLYLELAEQATNTTVDLASIKAEEEERKERASIRALRAANEVDPYARRYVPSIDLAMVTHLRDVQRKLHALKPEFERHYKKAHAASKRKEGEAEHTLERISALQALLRISANVEYHFLSGLLSERIGALSERLERGTGLTLVKSAASYFELLGDKENALSLKTLARERYKRAAYLYGVAKDSAGAERISAKCATPPVPPAPPPSGEQAPNA